MILAQIVSTRRGAASARASRVSSRWLRHCDAGMRANCEATDVEQITWKCALSTRELNSGVLYTEMRYA
jgi:hypothetical protein